MFSFSGSDYIGHYYGMYSQEQMDEYLRLDQVLQRFFDTLDQRIGLQNVVVALAADHGATPMTEWSRANGRTAKRVHPAVIGNAVRRALAERFPNAGDLIATYSAPDVYFDLDAIAKAKLTRKESGDRRHCRSHGNRRGRPRLHPRESDLYAAGVRPLHRSVPGTLSTPRARRTCS